MYYNFPLLFFWKKEFATIFKLPPNKNSMSWKVHQGGVVCLPQYGFYEWKHRVRGKSVHTVSHLFINWPWHFLIPFYFSGDAIGSLRPDTTDLWHQAQIQLRLLCHPTNWSNIWENLREHSIVCLLFHHRHLCSSESTVRHQVHGEDAHRPKRPAEALALCWGDHGVPYGRAWHGGDWGWD